MQVLNSLTDAAMARCRRRRGAFAVFAIAVSLCACNTPKVRFGYIATGQGIYAFRIDAGTGASSQVFGSPFVSKTNSTAAASPSSVIVHPANGLLYATNQDINSISRFKIDKTTGALTEVLPRTPLTTASGGVGLSPAVMAMDSGGTFLFVGNQVTNDVWAFSIGTSGALTFVSSAPLAAPPLGLTLSASGNLLYVPVPQFSAIYVFSVNSGALTQVGSPFIVSGGVGRLGIDPAGKFLYVPNPAANTVTVLSIQPDGSLAFGAGSFATETTPIAATTNPAGAYLYVANAGSANVSQFQIDTSNGALTPLTTSTTSTGTQPSQFVADPEAKFLFIINQQANTVTEYTINTGGALASSGNTIQASVLPRSFSITR
jgi:6-phosphogluconolactonase